MSYIRIFSTLSTYAMFAGLAGGLSCSAQRPAAVAPRPAKASGNAYAWHMKKVSQDGDIGLDAIPQFGISSTPKKHVTIVSMLIPTDWTFRTSQDHPSQLDCNLNTGKLILVALSPDQRSVFLSKPVPDTAWSNDRGVQQNIAAENQQWSRGQHCVVAPPQPLSQRMPALGKQMLPSLTPAGSLEPIPALSGRLMEMVSQANASLEQQARQAGQRPGRITAEAGRLRFTNHDASGDGEGYLYAMQVVRTDTLPNGSIVQSISVPMLFFTGAPAGQLEAQEPMFTAMAGSIQISPEYQAECMQVQANMMHIHQMTKQRLAQIQSEINADNARTAAKISSIQAGVSQYRSHVMSHVAANRSAALEHSSQQFALYMGDEAQYRDPRTGHNVILPSGADHVWASQTGNSNEYILTNSASYDPNGHAGSAGWSEMQVQH